jgi:hypothetical protein
MRKLRGSLLCLAAILVLQLVTHFWWWIVVVPFVYGAVASSSGWDGFRSGMLGAGGLWLVAAAWQLTTSAQLVSQRVAEMLGVGLPATLVAATMLVAMIVGGLAGSTGYSLSALRRPAHSRTRSGSSSPP